MTLHAGAPVRIKGCIIRVFSTEHVQFSREWEALTVMHSSWEALLFIDSLLRGKKLVFAWGRLVLKRAECNHFDALAGGKLHLWYNFSWRMRTENLQQDRIDRRDWFHVGSSTSLHKFASLFKTYWIPVKLAPKPPRQGSKQGKRRLQSSALI